MAEVTHRPRTGWPVFGIDDSTIGVVRDVRKDAFEVETREGRSFWLRTDSVFWAAKGHVQLVCNAMRIRFYETSPF